MPVQVGEGELRSGAWTLAAADQPGAIRPGIQVHQASELRHPRPVAWLAILVDRGSPSVLAESEDLLTHGVVDRVAQRETDAALPAAGREGVTGPGGIRAGENLTVQGTLRELLQRELQHIQVILGVVRAGAPRPQDPDQYPFRE